MPSWVVCPLLPGVRDVPEQTRREAMADAAQGLVQFAGMTPVELGEDFPLDLARQIGTRARVRDEEFRKAEGCAHPDLAQLVTELFMRLVNAEEKGQITSISTDGGDCPG